MSAVEVIYRKSSMWCTEIPFIVLAGMTLIVLMNKFFD